MPSISYTLTVHYPLDVDADTQAEVELAAEAHDTTDAERVERWVGGFVGDAASQLSAWLPEGWRATVERVEWVAK